MKNLLKKWFTHNLLLKIAALVIALLLWFIFYSEADPITQGTFRVNVEVQHLDEFLSDGHYVSLEDEEDISQLQLDVVLSARSSVLEQLRDLEVSSFIHVYVDLYELEGSTSNRLMIHYEMLPGIYYNRFNFVELRNQSYYIVTVDDSSTKEIEVQYEISGMPEDGYMFLVGDEEIQISPETITITGPSTQLEEVAYGKVRARVSGATANVNSTNDIVLYNSNDEVIDNTSGAITKSVEEASVFVPIYMVKTVELKAPQLEGSVPNGYEYASDLAVSVDQIEIYGQESVLNRIEEITLPSIDLSEITSDYSETLDLNEVLQALYPDNEVRLTENSASEVQVTFSVQRQRTRQISVPTSRITVSGASEEWTEAFTGNTLQFTVVGLAEKVEALDPNQLTLTVRLKESDFIAGKHNVDVAVTGLGTNVRLQTEPLTVEMEFTQTP